jgi:predicted ArsR family transcriptional regulator
MSEAGVRGRNSEAGLRRQKVPALWDAGLTAREIAGRLGVTHFVALGDIAALQARGVIAKRNAPRAAVHRVPRRSGTVALRPVTTPADRARSKAAYEREKDAFAKAKRVVTIAQSGGDLRVIKFFADCAEALAAPRRSITGVCGGIVTGDAVYAASGGGKSNVWSVWQVLEGAAA